MIKEVKGDLLKLALEGHFDYIIHGCNCFNTMGAGIALQIREQFPLALLADCKTRKGDIDKLSDWTIAPIKYPKFFIVNLYTQYETGANFNISALDLGLYKFSKNLHDFTPAKEDVAKIRIGLPQIGAGIGGGDWDNIRKVIRFHLHHFNTTIVYYNK